MSRKPRLLIVEDEAAIRSGLADVFVYHGYEVGVEFLRLSAEDRLHIRSLVAGAAP